MVNGDKNVVARSILVRGRVEWVCVYVDSRGRSYSAGADTKEGAEKKWVKLYGRAVQFSAGGC